MGEPMHMTLCEFGKLVPRPGQTYIAVHIPGCEECDRLAAMQREAYGASSPTVNEDGSLAGLTPTPETREEWERRKAQAWASRNLRCGCDHIEYCGQCYPPAFRKGGEFYEWPAGEGSK